MATGLLYLLGAMAFKPAKDFDGRKRTAEEKALDAIAAIADNLPDAVVGAGTVTTPRLVRQAVDAGARFLVSPGTTSQLLDAMDDAGVPCLPGIASVSEAMRVLEHGQREMKFFPAAASGGRAFLTAIAPVLPTARFCPTGGITPTNVVEYLATPNVGCVGGSWLTPADVVDRHDWPRISSLATAARELTDPTTRKLL